MYGSWIITVKLVCDLPRNSHVYFVEHIKATARQQILTRLNNIQDGSKRFKKMHDGSIRLRNDQEEYIRFKMYQEI